MTLPKSVSKWINTKVDADSPSVKTHLTFDLSLLTWADILEYAIMALVVKWQGTARKLKTGIPASATMLVQKPGVRSTVDPRETAIVQLMAAGYTRETATFILDNADKIKAKVDTTDAEVED